MSRMLSLPDLLSAGREILLAVPRTLAMAAFIMVAGVLLGFVLHAVRWLHIAPLAWLLDAFVSYMLGVPIIVNLFLAEAILPDIAVAAGGWVGFQVDPRHFPPVVVALVALTLYQGAVQSENIRGLLRSVDRGQLDAARASGFSTGQAWRRILLPQLLVTATPILVNSTIKTIKALSLAFAISVVEIFATAKLVAALNGRYLEAYLAAALTYWVLCGALTVASDWWERRHASAL